MPSLEDWFEMSTYPILLCQMRNFAAIRKSQQDSLELSSRGLVRNDTYENTPSVVLEDMYDDGSIPMSFFDEMNEF